MNRNMAQIFVRFGVFLHLVIKAWTSKKCPSQITCPSIRKLVTSDVIPGTCQTQEEDVQ